MGCDIHAYVDYDEPNDFEHKWVGHLGEFILGRDYFLFSLMAGVRGNEALFQPKGLPEHLSWRTLHEAALFIVDGEREESGTCTQADAERYHQSWLRHKEGVGGYVGGENGDKKRVYHPDWHSHSWLTSEELKQVIDKYASHSEPHLITAKKVDGEWVIPEGYKPDPSFASFFEKKKEEEDYQFMPLVSITPIALKAPATVLAVYHAMKSLEESGCVPRLVFWFDN